MAVIIWVRVDVWVRVNDIAAAWATFQTFLRNRCTPRNAVPSLVEIRTVRPSFVVPDGAFVLAYINTFHTLLVAIAAGVLVLATCLAFLGKFTSVAICPVDVSCFPPQITLCPALFYPLETCLIAMEAGVLQA